jgi:hypothetical protein
VCEREGIEQISRCLKIFVLSIGKTNIIGGKIGLSVGLDSTVFKVL